MIRLRVEETFINNSRCVTREGVEAQHLSSCLWVFKHLSRRDLSLPLQVVQTSSFVMRFSATKLETSNFLKLTTFTWFEKVSRFFNKKFCNFLQAPHERSCLFQPARGRRFNYRLDKCFLWFWAAARRLHEWKFFRSSYGSEPRRSSSFTEETFCFCGFVMKSAAIFTQQLIQLYPEMSA